MKCIDQFRHLNERNKFYVETSTEGIKCYVELDIERVVAIVVSMNYGVHRFLSALARQRLAANIAYDDELADGILALLEKGLI